MNQTTFFSMPLTVLLLTLCIRPSWAGPPNNVISDGFHNTAGGTGALFQNGLGKNNTGFGFNALNSNSQANNSTAIGAEALRLNTSGSSNTATGSLVLQKNTTGSANTAMGYLALQNKTTGSNNLALGQSAGRSLIAGNSNIYLNNVGTATESSTIRIGNATNHTRAFIAGVRNKTTGSADALPVFIDINGQLGTIKSSQRYKKDIHDMDASSRRLLELRPVTYRYKQASEDGSNPLEYGLIAEEVAKVYPDLVAYGADGKIETVQYHKLTPMLVNEVQRLNVLLQAEKDKNVAQGENIKIQEQEIASLKKQMTMLQAQSERIEALTSRLSRIEAKESLGMAEKVAGKHPG